MALKTRSRSKPRSRTRLQIRTSRKVKRSRAAPKKKSKNRDLEIIWERETDYGRRKGIRSQRNRRKGRLLAEESWPRRGYASLRSPKERQVPYGRIYDYATERRHGERSSLSLMHPDKVRRKRGDDWTREFREEAGFDFENPRGIRVYDDFDYQAVGRGRSRKNEGFDEGSMISRRKLAKERTARRKKSKRKLKK